VLIHRLLGDPKVQAAVEAHAAEHKLPVPAVLDRVERYAREIVPAFNAWAYFRVGNWVGRKVSKGLYAVRLGYVDTESMKAVPESATVVFVMNHRSNMDYILASHLAVEQAALSYAVGEWARTWPLSALIRSMGRLLRAPQLEGRAVPPRPRVLRRDGDAGGRAAGRVPGRRLTRDGLLRRAAPGRHRLHAARLHARRRRATSSSCRSGSTTTASSKTARCCWRTTPNARQPSRFWAVWNTLGFVVNNLRLMLESGWRRFGYACVNFGTPVSMRAWCAERGIDFQKLAATRAGAPSQARRRAHGGGGPQRPVLPVPLIATVFVQQRDRPISELELKAEVKQLVERLEAAGAHIYVPRQDLDYAVTVGLRALTLRRLLAVDDGLYQALRRAAADPLLRQLDRALPGGTGRPQRRCRARPMPTAAPPRSLDPARLFEREARAAREQLRRSPRPRLQRKLVRTEVPAQNSASTFALSKPLIGPQSRPTARAATMK
jgi:glycerol-3-phosphate O-acyltransferase